MKAFEKLEKIDQNEEGIPHGQRVAKCVSMADISLLHNEDFNKSKDDEEKYFEKIQTYLELVEKPGSRQPAQNELMMNLAGDVSLMSVCFKQQVGAVIIDENGIIQSLGYNRTPDNIKDCAIDFKQCFRDYIVDKSEKCNECGSVIDIKDEDYKRFGKNLDQCR
ncbi:unnamed protein product, partial [marine sediment metagenome]